MGYRRSGYSCIRIVFGLLNAFFWVLGSGLIGLGIWLQISYNGFFTILPQHEILNLEYLLLMSGVLFFITAFLGCGGAWCKNGCLLTLYFVLVALFCVAEITCGILGFFFSDHLSSNLQQELLTGMQYYYNISSNNLGITMGWDHVQHELSCCGVHTYFDWFNISAWPGENFVPHSCCIPAFEYIEECGRLNEISMWFPSGCYNQVKLWFEEHLHLFSIFGFVVAVLQLFGMISSMLLFCSIRRRASWKTYKAEKSPALL